MGNIFQRENLTIPNIISTIRIMIIPFIAYFYLNDNLFMAVVMVIISGFSDLFDGMIARNFNQVTELGKMLDPLADKLTQGTIALCLAIRISEIRIILVMFLVKELSMLCGAFALIKIKKKPCAAQWYGKVATTLFYLTIAVILVLQQFKPFTEEVQSIVTFSMLSVTAGFMLYALVRYIMIFIKILRSDDKQYYYDWQEKRQQKKQIQMQGQDK